MLPVFMPTFLAFTWEFSIWEFSSVHSNSQKSVYCCLLITLWNCEYCLIWALNKSVLFGSNSMKVSVLWDVNSEKSFYYSLIWKELSIVWYKLYKCVLLFASNSLKISVLFDNDMKSGKVVLFARRDLSHFENFIYKTSYIPDENEE